MNATLDQMTSVLNSCDENSPYLLENETAYQAWRARKLDERHGLSPTRVFALNRQGLIAASMQAALQRQVSAFNFVIFECVDETCCGEFDSAGFLALNRQFGLRELDMNLGADEDKVTALRVVEATDRRAQYIPYSNRAMNWHTDGYYNPSGRRIAAFALYCVHQAGRGGGNYLFDHEMMYMRIRDQSPELLQALMCDDLMLIPANVQHNRVIRAEESGPVFSLQPLSCTLNMRFTSRPHNIVWKSDKRSERALNLVREILMDGDAMTEIRLQRGQGMVCNNILHGRQAFHNAPGQPDRLIYRARYYDAIDLEQGLANEASV
ncbi:MAG: TauD/TfdA family dioxygenase [Gammaproteobacteria bacterium]|nr:TauD/TfdA family dioxygenase [Gammaproteobacteria bacterium]